MLYKQTFSKLTVSPQIIQEVIDMTETKRKPKKFILRRLIVAALVMALAFALAMGANAATNGELFKSAVSVFSFTSEDGENIVVAINSDLVEEREEDGKVIYSFTEKYGEKIQMGYKDSNGKMVLKDIEPGADLGEIIYEARQEAEAAQAEDIQ